MEKKTIEFRLLKAGEIDCRIATVKQNGLSLLLYKDARVDQNLLDETVGPMNWQRSHSRDNANCVVSIWDAEKGQWVSKEDTGTESYTEKEKGLASDSFKRACFNWGIGRELYTAPFIWIPGSQCSIKETDDRGKKKYTCYDRFSVSSIGYDKEKNINALVIVNESRNRAEVYDLKAPNVQQEEKPAVQKPDKPQPQSQKPKVLVKEAHVQTLYNECGRTGVGWRDICKLYRVEALSDLTMEQFKDAMEKFKKYPDKAPLPQEQTAPPEDMDDSGLPWNTPR